MGRMRRQYLKTFRESMESQFKAGRHNPASVVKFSRRRFVLEAGSRDDLNFWSYVNIINGIRYHYLYVLSVGVHLGYVGLQEFCWTQGESPTERSLFWQIDCELEETFGKKWDLKSHAYLFRVAQNYLQ